jgi:hypothetical protein
VLPAEEEDGEPEQTLPLDEIWPVQRAVDAPETGYSPRRAQEIPEPAHGETPASLPDDSGEKHPPADLAGMLRQALEGVTSQEESASPIEVIAPRVPRQAAVQLARQDAGERMPPGYPGKPMERTDFQDEDAASAEGQGEETVQRAVPGAGSGQEEGDGQDLVATGIGPLPSDLWTLIGEPSPVVEKPEEVSRPPMQPSLAPAIQKAETGAARPEKNAIPEMGIASSRGESPASLPQVQRAGEPDQQDEPPPATRKDTDRPAEAANPAQQPAGPDLDELARQVYADLKRRMAVELERLRRRS